MKDKPQFANAAEVRAFMGDVYDKVFGKWQEDGVLAMVAGGMCYTTDDLPAINYDKRKDIVANHNIAMMNATIRRCATGAFVAQCIQTESERAIVAGMIELARELVDNICPESLAHLEQSKMLMAQGHLDPAKYPTLVETPVDAPDLQLPNVNAVREFMGDLFDVVFADCTDKMVMGISETGMVFEDGLPLVKYDTSLTMQRNLIIFENNVKIRHMLTSDNFQTCSAAENRRANAVGIVGTFIVTEEPVQ